jgi:hypothetical protein
MDQKSSNYIKLILGKTVSIPFAVSGIASFIILLLQAANLKYQWVTDETMTTWGIIIPVLVFMVSVILFIFLAPYQIYKELKAKNEKLSKENKSLINGVNIKSKTETLWEMRSSKFYEVIKTLDDMRDYMDRLSQSKLKWNNNKNILNFIIDLSKITGIRHIINKIINDKKITNSQYRILSSEMARKWGELKNATDHKTVQFMEEIAGILKLYKSDIFDLLRKYRKFRRLERLPSSQRILISWDDTYKSFEHYLFYLRGYGNIFRGMIIGAGAFDINSVLTPEEKSQFANFMDNKNMFISKLLKDVSLSIDEFIKDFDKKEFVLA